MALHFLSAVALQARALKDRADVLLERQRGDEEDRLKEDGVAEESHRLDGNIRVFLAAIKGILTVLVFSSDPWSRTPFY